MKILQIFIKRMGIIIVYSLLFFFLIPSFASAAQAILQWETNMESDDIHEILIFQSNQSGIYDYSKPIVIITNIFQTEFTITGLDNEKIYYWVLRCKDKIGKLGISSNEVSTEGPPPPTSFKIFKYIPFIEEENLP